MKYIIVQSKLGIVTIETPIIFPERLVHEMMFEAVKPILPGKDHTVISAGEIDAVAVSCSGRSTSLKPNVESRGKQDEALINAIDYGAGMT